MLLLILDMLISANQKEKFMFVQEVIGDHI
jgi:hypothetical protein